MLALFVGNFDFEHVLANPHFQPSLGLQRLNAELALSWFAGTEDGDYLYCPLGLRESAIDQLTALGLPRLVPVTDFSQVHRGVQLVPWGWTEPLVAVAQRYQFRYLAPGPHIVREVNARQFSFDLENEWEVGLPQASAIHDLSGLDDAVQRTAEISSRCVVKANWGMSARERILIEGAPTDEHRAWVRKRLAEQHVVFVEPWVRRLEEVGIQIEVQPQVESELLAVTKLECDDVGQYAGSWFTNPPDDPNFQQRWRPAVEIALRTAQRLKDRGYFGPLGIDAMRYQLPDGSIRLRPLQDINARFTMGRLSLGWRKLLRDGECGFWPRGPRNRTFDELRPQRTIDVAPEGIFDWPMMQASRLHFCQAARS